MADTTFIDGATTVVAAWLNDVNDVTYTTVPALSTTVSTHTTQIATKAASGANTDITSLSAPALGAATATTQSPGDNTTKVATTAFVTTAVAAGTSLGSIQGSAKNLRASATGLSAITTVTADEIAVEDSSNVYETLRNVSLSISGTTTGANALDTGTIATSTWYSTWVIWNGTTTAGLLSLSATAPTLPSGYTHKARVGWIRTDTTGNKYPLAFTQFGKRVRYKVAGNVTGYPAMASGAQGNTATPTWVSVAVANFIPTTAASIHGTMFNNGGVNGNLIIAPNNAHGALTSNTNPPYASINASSDYGQRNFEMLLESANIYVAGNSGSYWLCQGWEDNL